MNNNRQKIIYIVIGILMGVIVIMGIMFWRYTDKLKTMEIQLQSMQEILDDAVAQSEAGENAAKAQDDVDAAYVDPEDTEPKEKSADSKTEKKNKKEEADDEVSAAEEFNDLEPQVENLLSTFQSQVGGKWSVYVEDLDSGGSMSLNDEKMQAASLIKLYIMGAVYENYDSLSSEGNLEDLLNQMITVSDNDAANNLVKLLGGGDAGKGMDKVNSFCVQYNYTSTQMGRLLLEENPTGENYTSASDCGKFLYHVYNKKFTHADEMMELLKAQTRTTKIPAGIPEGIEVANKTGELDDVQNDAAIVFGEKIPYIVCIMSEGVSGTEAPVSAISTLSSAIYGYTNQT